MIDLADRAAADEERAMELFQRERERLGGGTAAVPLQINCVDCGELVPMARLAAVPRTLRCAACASEVERR
jgi:RNA polymerase-binding transcription factor DksA